MRNRVKDWKNERSPRFAAFSRREADLFVCFSVIVPACLNLTRGGATLPIGLLEGSCGRRKRRRMPNRLNVACMPAYYLLLPLKETTHVCIYRVPINMELDVRVISAAVAVL